MLTNFVDKQTTVTASWLNGIDQTVNGALQGGITAGQILQALGLGGGGGSLPIQVSQGGTSATDAPTALANLGGTNASQVVTIIGSTVTRSFVGGLIGPPTLAEQAVTGLTIVDDGYEVNNLLRYGIIPNDPTKAQANGLIMQTLFNPQITAGPTGLFWSPNNGNGSPDIYYFNFDGPSPFRKGIELRDDCTLDLNGCTWNFSSTFSSLWNTRAFIQGIRDITIQNGNIQVNFNGSSGTNAGMTMLMGSRPGYPFSIYPNGIYDQDDLVSHGLPPMGNIVLKNLRITSNNPSAPTGPTAMVHMLGGLRNVVCENLVFNGQNVVNFGIYYEFGFASNNGSPSNQTLWTSSHATGMKFTNIYATNLNTLTNAGTFGGGVGLGGSHDCILENIIVDSAICVFTYTPGEALFFRPWVPTDFEGAKRSTIIRNPVGSNISGNGLVLGGSSSVSGGYLNAAVPPLTLYQQVDLMTFIVEGGAVNAAGAGLNVSGAVECRGLKLDGPSGSGQVIVQDDCSRFHFDGMDVIGSSGIGFRLSFPGVFSPARPKMGAIERCLIAGNTIGIAGGNIQAMRVSHNRIGYNTAYDAQAEVTQTQAVNLNSTCENCKFDSNITSIGAGTVAYVTVALSSGLGNELINPMTINSQSQITFTPGAWDIDGMAFATAAQIASIASVVNQNNKYLGRRVWDTNNLRMYIAQGSTPGSAWDLASFGTVQAPVIPS